MYTRLTMKNFLITGASGFLGDYFTKALTPLGKTVSIGRTSVSNTIHSKCDISTTVPTIPDLKYDVVIHNAGLAHQEHLKKKHPEKFFEVNTQGTINLLTALKGLTRKPTALVFISTVAVYGCHYGNAISESHPLEGKDAYALSKIQAEHNVIDFCVNEHINYYIFRLPLVVGEHSKGNLRKMIDAIQSGKYIQIKNNHALKSMVLASDVAMLATQLEGKESGIYNLTDNIGHTFAELEQILSTKANKKIRIVLPQMFLKMVFRFGNTISKLKPSFPINNLMFEKLTQSLTFSSEKATYNLNWSPRNIVEYLHETNINKL